MIGIKIEVQIEKPGSHLHIVKPDIKKDPTEPEDSAGKIVTRKPRRRTLQPV